MEEFVTRQKELLALERGAELEEAAQLLEGVALRDLCQRGLALHRLSVAGTRTGLYGRTLVTFTSSAEFPAHTITSGDIVGVRDKECGCSLSLFSLRCRGSRIKIGILGSMFPILILPGFVKHKYKMKRGNSVADWQCSAAYPGSHILF